MSNDEVMAQIQHRIMATQPDPHVDGWYVVDVSDLSLKFDEGDLDPAFLQQERAIKQNAFSQAQALIEEIFAEAFYGFAELSKLARVPANLIYRCYRLSDLRIETDSQSWGAKTYEYAAFANEKQRKAWQRGK